jgi:hypothetical protein
MIVVRWRSSSLPPLRIGTNVVIDNLIILTTCGGTLVVAIRAILMERREVARRAAAQPRTRR